MKTAKKSKPNEIAPGIFFSIRDRDEIRLEDPRRHWDFPVDLLTPRYDDARACDTGLDSNGLRIIRKRFGPNCFLDDIRIEMECSNVKFDGKGWPAIVKFARRLPDDNMAFNSANTAFNPANTAHTIGHLSGFWSKMLKVQNGRAIRKLLQNKLPQRQYHFEQLNPPNGRKWTLPKNEIPFKLRPFFDENFDE